MPYLQLIAAAVVAATLVSACSPGDRSPAGNEPSAQQQARPAAAQVDGKRIENADREPGNWMSYGRTYDEQRFSPLTAIDTGNAARLGLAWYYDLDAAARAQESTPLVIDGVMYVTSAWSKVFALDAATGRQLWVHAPKVPGAVAVHPCCARVERRGAAC